MPTPPQRFSFANRTADSSPLTVIKASLKDSCYEGDLQKVESILHRWKTDFSLPALTPDDLAWPLSCAVSSGHISIVRLLLDRNAPITTTTTNLATRDDKPNSLAIFEALREHGWSVESVVNKKTRTMAMNSVMKNPDAESLVHWFLSHGAPPNGLDSDPGSPLRSAPTPAIASILLSYGANLKFTSALHAAAVYSDESRSLALMNFLLDNGIDIDEFEFEGRPVTGRLGQNRDHGTALHKASRVGEISRVTLLVERGADVSLKSKFGYTARDNAQLYGKGELKEYLEGVMRERGIEIRELDVPEGGRRRQ